MFNPSRRYFFRIIWLLCVLDLNPISLHTFPLVLTTLVAYFGLYLGDLIEAPEEPRVPFGYLDINYNSSSFLESYEKMAGIDIDPFWRTR